MAKQSLRERVWDELEASGVARFPYPPHDRIPNFAGADAATERLAAREEWAAATTMKANPDAPQLPVRRAALSAGTTLFMAVPRLRDERCFRRLAPDELTADPDLDDLDDAATIGGSETHGVPVHPESMPTIELIVAGSVAVTEDGARVGKGEGYSDLEFAVLREFGLVDDETTTATTVHERQVVEDGAVETAGHDVPMDLVVTPGRVIETGRAGTEKADGIDWSALSAERRAEIPVIEALAPE